MNLLLRGAWASVMATSSMTMAMFKMHQGLDSEEQSPLPPALLTDDIQRKIGLAPNAAAEIKEELTMFSHYGYGALGGMTYSALTQKSEMHPLLKGSLFGLGVWGVSYFGLIPGLNLNPSGTKMTPSRNAMMLLAHLAWGASLGFAENELKKRGKTLLDGKSNPHKLQ
ncbi:hypothetical protein AZI86_13290 [Bdellovibrio bacteriovorus]|uniref:DUF1440 domain-containing protein n=1 Tax=Bdellovibrio bacteriovorus TaxID=959 RepID=A0A150WJ99_BDEBC|nr:hypothetical protein [Bdellovibrio bacteriovorus]KYG63792.1 hypothetical protein AZI86_13290 [Bdellovibrio bacteriovorus]